MSFSSMPPPPWPAPGPPASARPTIPPGTRLPGGWMLAIGIVLALLSPVGLLLFGFGAAMTGNACGPFADGCDEYGQTGDGFEWMVAGLGLSGLAFVVGCVLTIVGWATWRGARRRLLRGG